MRKPLTLRKENFISTHGKILEKLKSAVGPNIEIESITQLDNLDPLTLPSYHEFSASKKVLRELIGVRVRICRSEAEVMPLDIVISTYVDIVRDQMGEINA